jgi:hypothetical protein
MTVKTMLATTDLLFMCTGIKGGIVGKVSMPNRLVCMNSCMVFEVLKLRFAG